MSTLILSLESFCHYSYFLAQKEAKTSTPYQTTPYMGCLKRKVAETVDFSGFLVSRDTRWGVYRLAHKGCKPGHGFYCLSAGAWKDVSWDTRWCIYRLAHVE